MGGAGGGGRFVVIGLLISLAYFCFSADCIISGPGRITYDRKHGQTEEEKTEEKKLATTANVYSECKVMRFEALRSLFSC